MKKNVVVLGSSGSIGKNTVKVLQQLPERFSVYGLAVKESVEIAAEQARLLDCRNLVAADKFSAEKLRALVPENCFCSYGEEALIDLVTAPEVDIVVCSIVGTAGLLPVLSALKAGKRIALASKEVMVMAGDLVNAELDAGHGSIVPVDSEHSALFQCLNNRPPEEVSKLIITASGGAFRDWSSAEIARATVKDALNHPVWAMGSKVTIDSATLMNKALEIVEAGMLFRMESSKIDVVIHPQSLVHSMVEMADGSVIAQLSQPDMRFAIQYALTYPERADGLLPKLDLATVGRLDFMEPDRKKYPSLDLAYAALSAGGTLPAVMNAANEVAVEAFIRGEVNVPTIWRCIEKVMEKHQVQKLDTVATAVAADCAARIAAAEFIKNNRI